MRRYLVEKDIKCRASFSRVEKDRLFYKSIVNNRFIEIDVREENYLKLCGKMRKNYLSHIKNRCNITGRGRAIISDMRVCGYTLKMLVKRKVLKGYYKGCW